MFIFLYLQAYCEAHCSNLAVFRDENDVRHVMDFMKHDDYISREMISSILLCNIFELIFTLCHKCNKQFSNIFELVFTLYHKCNKYNCLP